MAIGAVRAAGIAAVALGYHFWKLLTKHDLDLDTSSTEEVGAARVLCVATKPFADCLAFCCAYFWSPKQCVQSLRSHPLGPEVELSSFSGNSSQVAESVPSSPALSPRLLPALPAQLESEDTALELDRWNDIAVTLRQRKKLREYELSAVRHDQAPASPSMVSNQATPIQPQHTPSLAHNGSSSTAESVSDANVSNGLHDLEFHTPSSQPDAHNPALQPTGQHQTPSQESILDSMFPSIKKIMPVGTTAHSASAAHAKPNEQLHDHTVCHMLLCSL